VWIVCNLVGWVVGGGGSGLVGGCLSAYVCVCASLSLRERVCFRLPTFLHPSNRRIKRARTWKKTWRLRMMGTMARVLVYSDVVPTLVAQCPPDVCVCVCV
jgi:hypothetical protein